MALRFDRRAFLRGGCALVAAGCAPPGPPGETSGPGDTGHTGESADTGVDAAYPCEQLISPGEGWFELPLAQWPDLGVVGGWYPVDVGGVGIVVALVEEGCYSAILRACAHQGVDIAYKPERWQYACPAHGAIYATNGEAVAGPQPHGLPVYPCGRVGDSVWVKVA